MFVSGEIIDPNVRQALFSSFVSWGTCLTTYIIALLSINEEEEGS